MEIVNSDITEGILNGAGSFDVLMDSVNRHLLEEFSKNRIIASDYSNVYLGAMQSVMQQAMQFQLGRQAADKQAELLGKQVDLTIQQIIGAKKDNELKDKQMDKMDEEILVLKQQVLKSEQDVLVAKEQVKVMKQTVLKMIQEVLLMKQQVLTAATQRGLIGNQSLKAVAEKELIIQKTATEIAQVKENPVDPKSTVGLQRSLYAAQTGGFARDAEQKLSKLLIDGFNVRYAAADSVLPEVPETLHTTSINEVVNKAKAGIV